MTVDDLTRRAIIAAHKAACGPQCDGYPPESDLSHLNERETAIVEAWRADREGEDVIEPCTHGKRHGPFQWCPRAGDTP